MATTSRPEDTDVNLRTIVDLLESNPNRFEFFQAVRLLERIAPERSPVGRFAKPERECVRFSVHNSLAFPASQIQAIDWTDTPPRLIVNFMGLTGPLGVLPYSYTELIVTRLRAKDRTLEAFLDLFHHRMISFFYQAWEKYRFPVAYERDRDDRLSRQLRSLIGLGTPGLKNRLPVPDESLLFYTGLLSLQPRSASALRNILQDYFGVGVEIEEFVGSWYALERDNQCCFEDSDSYSGQLGFGAVVGHEIWDQQARVRVKLGPLTQEQYLGFLPTGAAYPLLKAMTRFYTNGEIEYEIQLELRQDAVPRCELTGPQALGGPMLGWFTWMKSSPVFDRNPSDTILLLN